MVFIAFLGGFTGLWVTRHHYLRNLKQLFKDPDFEVMHSQLLQHQHSVFRVKGYCKDKARIQDCSDAEMRLLFPYPFDRKYFGASYLLEATYACAGMDDEPALKFFFIGDL